MSVTDLIKLISEVGVLVVIAAIFLYTAIRLINIGLELLQKKAGNKKHDKLLEIRSQVSSEIQTLLETFVESHDAGRIMVMEFSNSVTSVAYLPFKYMTCTYEVYDLERQARAHKVDHLSTSLFTPFFNTMLDKDYYIFNDTNNQPKMGGALVDIMRELGEHQFICSLLISAKGKNIGFICMNKDSGFNDKDVEGIQSLAAQVSALLGVADM